MRSFVFPGQGAQHKGMGGELFLRYPELTAQADEILGYSIAELCLQDPEGRLAQTQFTQPAIYVVSALALRQRADQGVTPEAAAGHSVGEYCALHAAGALDFATGLRLVKRRGELMAAARGGGMAAVVGLDEASVREVLRAAGLVSLDVANLNSPRQIVLSGRRDEVVAAEAAFDAAGCTAYIVLNVSGAFHSRHMAGAREDLRRSLDEVAFGPLRIPVVSNVTARPYADAGEIRRLLGQQLTEPVRWVDSIRYLMGRGCTEFVEVGPGKVLTGLVNKIREECTPLALEPERPAIEGGAPRDARPPASGAARRRVVITGMGINAPAGDNLEDYYRNLMAGRSGIRKVTSIDMSKVRAKVGGDLGDYDFDAKLRRYGASVPDDVLRRLKKIFKTAPFSTRLTMVAALDAYLDAGLFGHSFDRTRMCATLGGHNFHDNYLYRNVNQFAEEPEYIDGLMGVCQFDSDIVASIAETLQIHGPMYTVGGTCTSAGLALRSAIQEIQHNDCDLAITGGGCIDYSPVNFQALVLVSAISFKRFNDAPEKASRPYDTQREGFVPSHGSGMLVVEELEHARRRGARIHAEVLAVESNNDGNHLTNPSVDGQARVMRRALEKAGVRPEQIDYVNAHATATPLGDRVEIQSIKTVFGAHARKLKINATKSIIGHTGWTAHTAELIAAILQMKRSSLHPSINIDELDPEIDLDVCADGPVENFPIRYLLKNSFGFGGINCSAVLKRWEA
jgi:malonyl CoA-acyl carrier protein transacylase